MRIHIVRRPVVELILALGAFAEFAVVQSAFVEAKA